jgi:hypothetical protein
MATEKKREESVFFNISNGNVEKKLVSVIQLKQLQ